MNEFSVLIEAFIRKKQEDKKETICVSDWLDSAAKRASQIAIATHVLKYINSDAKGTNICIQSKDIGHSNNYRYVSTDTLTNSSVDIVGNAAAMDVASFVEIEVNGVKLLELIKNNDPSPFAPFTNDQTKLSAWMNGFRSILIDQELSSHTLAKQIYFPIGDDEYHLLSPLHATLISQTLFETVKEERFGEKAKIARECRRNEQYSEAVVVDFPKLAIQTFGGTNKQNISRMNSIRGGKAYLLRNAPPEWTYIKRPPMKKDDFWYSYQSTIYETFNSFVQYLYAVRHRDNNADIRIDIQNYIDQLLDMLILSAAKIQAMPSGWSEESEIPLHEKYWLDPSREEFLGSNQESWMEDVSHYFATWIIRKLKGKKNELKFSDIQYEHFYDNCLRALKEA